jgi:hypothetical protein
MSSIINNGDTYHGISVIGCGVFTNGEYGMTYAGQCKDGYACGLGVLTWPCGSKAYAEHGPDGQWEGRWLRRPANGGTIDYVYERGETKLYAIVRADGSFLYNWEDCAPDDPRLLALIAQVAPVEVRPAPPAPHRSSARHSPPRNRPMDQPARFAPAGAREDHCHRGAPPRRTPPLAAVRHNPTAAALNCVILFPGAFLAGLCSFGIPFGFGRPRKPWSTCRCAWRCARTAGTEVGGVLLGYSTCTPRDPLTWRTLGVH